MANTMLVLVIASILALFRKEWEQIKAYIEISILWVIGSILMDIAIVSVIPISEAGMSQMVMNFVLLSFNLIIGVLAYIKQRS
jgi:hypothetical protein